MNDIETVKDKLIDAQNEILRLRVDDALSSKNWKTLQADNLKYANENMTLRTDYAELMDEDEDLGRVNEALVAECAGLRDELARIKPEWADTNTHAQLAELTLADAWAAIENDNSKDIHLEPRQAEALILERKMLMRTIDRLAELVADRSPAHPYEIIEWEMEDD